MATENSVPTTGSLRKKMAQFEKLAGISVTLNSTNDLDKLIKLIISSAASLLDCEAVSILLYSPEKSSLYFAESSSDHAKRLAEIYVPVENSLAGIIFLENKPLLLNNIENDSRHFISAALHVNFHPHSLLGVPMRFQDQTIGVIEALNKMGNDFNLDDQELLLAIASQAAVAIQNARMLNDLQDAYQSTLEGWSGALDLRDKEAFGHSHRVAELSMDLAREMGIPDDQLPNFRRGALLHDIGNMAVPDKILLKPGPLTESEWEVMRQHPGYAYNLLSPIAYLRPALDIPYCHHEKWDGSGYPRGLHGEQIPLSARIFTVIDVWDALLSERPYRETWSQEQARAHILAESGKSFDPMVVAAFIRLLDR